MYFQQWLVGANLLALWLPGNMWRLVSLAHLCHAHDLPLLFLTVIIRCSSSGRKCASGVEHKCDRCHIHNRKGVVKTKFRRCIPSSNDVGSRHGCLCKLLNRTESKVSYHFEDTVVPTATGKKKEFISLTCECIGVTCSRVLLSIFPTCEPHSTQALYIPFGAEVWTLLACFMMVLPYNYN